MQSWLPSPLFYKAVGHLTAPTPSLFPKPSSEQSLLPLSCSPHGFFQNLELSLRVCTCVGGSMCLHCAYTCVHAFDDQRCCPPFLGVGSLLGLELASEVRLASHEAPGILSLPPPYHIVPSPFHMGSGN